MTAVPPAPRRSITATTLTQYVRLDNCERFLHLYLRSAETRARLKERGLRIQPLTPLLADLGTRFETDAVARLREAGYEVVDLGGQHRHVPATLAAVRGVPPGAQRVIYQASVEGRLGEWPCHGDADLVRVARDANGALALRVADIKASKEDRLEHRLQVALYAMLLEQMLTAQGEQVASVDGVIVHRAHQHGPLDLDALEPFDLRPYRLALMHLVADADGPVTRAADTPLEQVPYHLTYKCDGCQFNALCMRDTAERHDLSLIPLLTAAEKRILHDEGITTVEQLAAIKQPPQPGQRGPLPVTPGYEALAARLAQRWRVGARLDLLSQRARAFAHHYDPAIETRSYLVGTGYGSLPADPADGLPLVKVFLDAQHDFLQDRIYMVGALITGPGGETLTVELTDGPPDDASEEALLQRWVPQLYAAVARAAGQPHAYVHLYLYDRYDQQLLLDALRRHLTALNMTALFDLLTAAPGADHPGEPALAQPMIAFLAQEFQEQRNPALTCQPLYDVAASMGFRWSLAPPDPGPTEAGEGTFLASSPFPLPASSAPVDYRRRFYARVFDGRRTISVNGRAVRIESAARFTSQIPLEYAYAVWGTLPTTARGEDDRRLAAFRGVSRDDLTGFMAHRMRALRHIEAGLTRKNAYLDKRPLNLAQLAFAALGEVDLTRAVEEFLHVEHYTKVQGLIMGWQRPVEERARQGQAMLVECVRTEQVGNDLRAHVRLRCDLVGVDPALALHQLALKEGDWVVINRAEDDQRPRRLLHGRLGVIRSLRDDGEDGPEGVIALLGASFPNQRFRYFHDAKLQPQPGELLLVDSMPDDLTADRHLAAVKAARVPATRNPLVVWIEEGAERTARPVDAALQRELAAALVAVRAASPFPLTEVQEEVIAGGLDRRLRLVQGPPGTGKSHTLGWAVVAQLAAARRAGAPAMRVAVTAKTHNAVNIVLASICEKLALVQQRGGPVPEALAGLRIVKLVNDEDADPAPHGVEALRSRRGVAQTLLETPLLVVGGTPGSLFNLARDASDPNAMWGLRPFDLLVVDEASQVNLPEGVTAAAFLKPEGRMIVVGDHRQMAPIVAHNWDDEERRSLKSAEVYRSLFDYLRARAFPAVALDRSFRLHRDLAAFLHRIIYHRDGVLFHSQQTHALPAVPIADPFAAAALDPAYPVVVVEHDEAHSQHSNETEAQLAARLLAVITGALGLDGVDGVGVVAPHRAQRALLQRQFPALAQAGAIDTVERFQGGERDVILVSATASDPDFVLGEADFLLDPNRLNVALSRPRKKLIVLASRTVFRLICADLEVFDKAVLWKNLRYELTDEPLWEGVVAGVGVRVLGRRAGA